MSDYLEHPELPPADNEHTDVSPRAFGVLLLAFGSIIVSAGLVVWWLYPGTLHDQVIDDAMPRYPSPVLQPSPPADMARFYAKEMRYLHGTGWVDRARGTVHVPIEQAMRKLVHDGIPDWPDTAPAPGSNGAAATPAAPAVPEPRP